MNSQGPLKYLRKEIKEITFHPTFFYKMKLNLPTIVDNHNDLPGVVNAAQVTDGDAAVHEAVREAAFIASNVSPQLGNVAAIAINQASTNSAPEDADDHNAKNAPAPENASAHPNVVLTPPNVVPAPLIDLPVPPNPEDAVPLVDVLIPPSNAPTAEETPTNVVVKMEQIVNEDVVLVRNKKYKEIMVVVLDDDDEDEDVAGE